MKPSASFLQSRSFRCRPGSRRPTVLGAVSSAAAALVMFAGHANADPPLKAEVMHWWTSAGESAAVRQIAEAYNKAGGLWVDNAIAGGETALAAEISRVTGGNPPTAMQL